VASIALVRSDVIVGVDTHKDQHVAVALDGLGGRLGELFVPATADGHGALVGWARGQGRVVAFGVEGTGSYGAGLASFLRRHALKVIEVNRPARQADRRLAGKSDTIDAEHAAREVLAGNATNTPKSADGAIEALRLIKIARDGAVKARSKALITLKASLVTGRDELRGELEGLTSGQLVATCAQFPATLDDPADPLAAMRYLLGTLARRWLSLHEEIKTHSKLLKQATADAAPDLVDAFGIGPDVAAEMLVTAGDNTDRVRSEPAFAKLCGACPIPTGSGKTNGRHRLNRGGSRQANAALYRTVIVRMRWHEPTIAYVARRTAEGLSKKEIIRCLKRYVAREIFALLPRPASLTPAASTQGSPA
jgi:transposase